MGTRNELTLFLGLRFRDAGRETLRRVEALLEEITAVEADTRIPLHWNVPLYPLFAGSSRPLHDLITEIKTRIKSRGDVLAPAGFRGAVHPLLDDHELERELSWCRRNPWMPGFREVLGQDPAVLVPFVPDLAREAAAGSYSAAGFRTLGLPFRLGGPACAEPRRRGSRQAAPAPLRRFLLSRDPERAAVVAAATVSLSELGEDSPVLASLASRAPRTLLLLLDVPAAPELGAPEGGLLSRLIDALSYRRSLRPAALSPQAVLDLQPQSRPPAGAGGDGVERPVPVSLLLHLSEACPLLEAEAGILPSQRLELARAYRRSGRRRNEDTRSALALFVPDPNPPLARPVPAGAARGPGFGRDSQVLSAEMGGAVALPGPEFVAHFVDGRLRGLSKGGKEIAGGSAAESWFVFAGVQYSLQTVSAASFERDGDHGLATTLAARLAPAGEEIQVLVEAYFREGQPELILECSVRFPDQAPALQRAAPYEIPLFRFGERLTPELQTELEDGSCHREQILPGEACLLTCGRRLRASLGGAAIVLTTGVEAPARGDAPPTVLPLRIRREPGAWALRALPGGRTCDQPALPAGGLVSHLSLRIGVQEPP